MAAPPSGNFKIFVPSAAGAYLPIGARDETKNQPYVRECPRDPRERVSKGRGYYAPALLLSYSPKYLEDRFSEVRMHDLA